MDTKYLIDTNVFLRFDSGQLYDKECFPTQYSNFLKLLDDGVAISIDKVKDELDDEFFTIEYEDIFKNSISNEITDTYNALRRKHSDYFNHYALENPTDADPYIITYAYHNNLCIVTQDEYQSSSLRGLSPEKYTIPTICEQLDAPCVDNKDLKDNINQYSEGFGCICLTELIRIEELMK